MRFMMLVKSAEKFRNAPPPQALMDAIGKLSEQAMRDGAMVQTGGLMPSAASARIRQSDGTLTLTDGPFTEAKEVVGGYAVFELPSKKEAVERCMIFMELHKKHWPEWEGETEIRPMMGPGDCGSPT